MNNKTSDKNVRNIEKDIERCEQLTKPEHANWIGISNQLAISHILAELKQKDKQIKDLEEERQLVGIPVRNKRDRRIGIVLHQWENGSVAVLERINPRIINTHDSWNTLEIITDEVNQVQTQENSIPKQVAIDEINEINKKYEDSKNENGENPYFYPNFTIKTLQKLLEGEK